MQEMDDNALLREFVDHKSDEAFATLVTRHINKVYSVALRHTRNPHHAEEITQSVFVILARKSAKLGKDVILSGWLYQTARLASSTFIRGEIRRAHREQEAYMQSSLNETESDVWRQIAPYLDSAMAGLNESDRHAVVLRFFDGRTLGEVGAALGAREEAAKKRVARAVEKLRTFFIKRGVVLSGAVLTTLISTNSVQAAPAGLAVTVSTAAAKGALAIATMSTLTKQTMNIMTWLKLKWAIGAGVAALVLTGGIATVAISKRADDAKQSSQEIAKKAETTYAALSSYSSTGTVYTEGPTSTNTTTFEMRMQRPNFYSVGWSGTGLYEGRGSVWSDGTGNFYVNGAVGQEQNEVPGKMRDMEFNLGVAAGVSSTVTTMVPKAFFGSADVLKIAASGRFKTKREADEKIGAVNCFVLSTSLEPKKLPGGVSTGSSTTILWIGKRDSLIHQVRTISEGASMSGLTFSDANLATILGRQNKPVTPESIAALRDQLETAAKKSEGGKFVFTQIHENISVNKKFTPRDFARSAR